MESVALTIGSFSITWYSIIILTGVIVAWILIRGEAKRFGIRSDFVTNLLFWTILMGILGARVYYVIFKWSYYSNHISEIFKVWEGGLAIHGGLIFGLITLIIYCKKYKMSILRMLDIATPYILFAQAIGRWGNFFNQEAYGTMTTLEHLRSLKFIPDFFIYGMNINGNYYTPTFFYESLWCLLGFIILVIVRRFKYIRIGQTAGLYMIWYGIGRFYIESLRLDSLMLGSFRVAQIVSGCMIIVGIIIILLQSRKPKLEDMYNNKEKVNVVNF